MRPLGDTVRAGHGTCCRHAEIGDDAALPVQAFARADRIPHAQHAFMHGMERVDDLLYLDRTMDAPERQLHVQLPYLEQVARLDRETDLEAFEPFALERLNEARQLV